MDFLKESVKIAIRKSLDSLASAHPGESVCGYALLTDDDLQCLGYHAITKERLEKGGSELRFRLLTGLTRMVRMPSTNRVN